MNEESLKKTLFLILKVVVKNSGFLSQLEIFRDVNSLMQYYCKSKGNIKVNLLII